MTLITYFVLLATIGVFCGVIGYSIAGEGGTLLGMVVFFLICLVWSKGERNI